MREAVLSDLPQIAAVARAAGQDEEWGGAGTAYVTHLLAHGRVVVGLCGGSVVGFGATRAIGTGPAAVSMLCDLFVHPGTHGRGCGRAILSALWPEQPGPGPGRPRRMTFSSQHASALPLYTRFGLDAWWPLLYLGGEARALRAPGGWTVSPASVTDVAAAEQDWTGVDRSADHRAWAARPHGQPVRAFRHGELAAAGTAGGHGDEYGLVHLAIAPGAPAGDAVLAVLARLDAPGGRARVCLPAPHPAVRLLFAAGWRHGDSDLFMASDPGLLDPRRAVPNPGGA